MSVLQWTPSIEDEGKFLVCRATNPKLQDAGIEERWKLKVHCEYILYYICHRMWYRNLVLVQMWHPIVSMNSRKPPRWDFDQKKKEECYGDAIGISFRCLTDERFEGKRWGGKAHLLQRKQGS